MQRGGMMDPGARAEQRLTRLKSETQAHRRAGSRSGRPLPRQSRREAGKGMQAMRERMQSDKPVHRAGAHGADAGA